MKKILLIVSILVITMFLPQGVKADNLVNIYFFYGDGCPHCAEQKEWLKEIKKEYKNVVIYDYETWYNEENRITMQTIKDKFNVSSKGVPFTVIGDKTFIGFSQGTATKMEERIIECSKQSYQDTTGVFLGKVDSENQGEELESKEETEERREEIKEEEHQNMMNRKLWKPLLILGSVVCIVAIVLGVLYIRNKKIRNN